MRNLVLAATLSLIALPAAAQTVFPSMELDFTQAKATIGVGGQQGSFKLIAGAMQFDAAKPENSTIAISLDVGSLDNQELQTALDLEHYPELRIQSTAPAKGNAGGETLPTILTIHEIDRPAMLKVSFTNVSAQGVTVHAEANVKSGDYKLAGKSGPISIVVDAPFKRVASRGG